MKRVLSWFLLAVMLVASLTITASAAELPKVSIKTMRMNGTGSVLLTWDEADGADGYYIYCGETEKVTYNGYSAKPSYTVTNLTPGKTYYFSVIVRKEVNGEAQKGPQSAPVAFEVKPLVVKAVGAKIEGHGTEWDFSAEGKAEFKITADQNPEYWIINGVRYNFIYVQKIMTIKDLTWPLTIEAVPKNGKPQTLLSSEDIQAARTELPCIVTAKSADMAFITVKDQVAKGGWFREFDFTNAYTDPAQNKQIAGGEFRARCKARIPDGKEVKGWMLDEAKFLMPGGKSSEFVVANLNTSMVYEPVLGDRVITYTVQCKDCTFSGGGYTNATSGSVPAGTVITVKATYPYNGTYVHWTGTYNTPDSNSNEAKPSFTWTVNSNCYFNAGLIVN